MAPAVVGGGLGASSQALVKLARDGPMDWTAIELQGFMEARNGTTVNGLPVGDLARKGEKGVTLTVGNQRLDGKIVECKQPIAVMSRIEGSGEGGSAGEFEIAGFIRRKMVFLHRPTVVTQSWTSPQKDLGTQEL